MSSSVYESVFPDTKLKEDEKARGRWKTEKGGGYVAVGVGGPITGRGANVLLLDDVFKNREEAESEVIRDKVWAWFTSTAYTRLEPGGVVIIPMTRWHMDDLTGRILAHPEFRSRTKLINFSAISDFEEEYRGQHVALWPEKYDLEELLSIKEGLGPYDWACLYQGSPILTDKQELMTQWLRPISESYVQMMSTRRYLTIDTAMSKKTSSDFTGFCDNRVNSQNFWHLKAWRLRVGPEELVNTLFTLQQANNYEKIGIEKTSYLWGLKPFLDEEMRKRNKFLPIVELDHRQTAKEVRIRGIIPRYASGSIFHIAGHCGDLEEEMRTFPLGSHDDVLDAVAYQLQIAENNLAIEETKQSDPFDQHALFG